LPPPWRAQTRALRLDRARRVRSATERADFLVDFEPLPRGSYADAYFGLRDDLERLLERPVDLVVESAIKNPYFRESVETTQALLYGLEAKDYLCDTGMPPIF
jgi:hypothetical protein